MIIFKIHEENTFGVKKLTDADLGQNTGHQTHIGLYKDTLTHLKDEDKVNESYLIFQDRCERLDCFFDRIENQDGSFRSPKIRIGNTASIVRRIREYASHSIHPLYLMWFGLDNKELIFVLFEEGSEDFQFFRRLGVIGGSFRFTEEIQQYVFSRFDSTNEDIMVELELNSQGIQGNNRYRRIDIERANQMFRQTGRIGEELVFKYLDQLKHNSKINDFSWVNKSMESGLPYDFLVTQNDNKERYIDVKTTRFRFESPIVFSSQEVLFISREPILYSVYRTYNIANKKEPLLRICDNSKDKMIQISHDYNDYCAICDSHGYKPQSSFLVSPEDPALSFTPAILI